MSAQQDKVDKLNLIKEIIKQGPEATPALRDMLASEPDADIRCEIIKAFGEIFQQDDD